MVTQEWLWTLSIAVPALLLFGWGVWGLGWLERRALWPRIGPEVAAQSEAVRPVWCGWALANDGREIRWLAGPLGERTWVRQGRGAWVKHPGILVGAPLQSASTSAPSTATDATKDSDGSPPPEPSDVGRPPQGPDL